MWMFLLFGNHAVSGGELPVVAGPWASVFKYHPGFVFHSGRCLIYSAHLFQKIIIVEHNVLLGVIIFKILCTVYTNTIESPVYFSPLHFENHCPYQGIFKINVLSIHIGPGKKLFRQNRESLVIGMAVNSIENNFYGSVWKCMQCFNEVEQYIRPAV